MASVTNVDKIDMLLEIYPDLSELFEVLDIEPWRVIEILLKGGHVSLPEFLSEEPLELISEDE
jgi:hypothetical protein